MVGGYCTRSLGGTAGLRLVGFLSALAITGCTEDTAYEPVHVHRFGESLSVGVLAGKPGPTWFGSHPILVVIHDGDRQIVIKERLHNDGANLSEMNFPTKLAQNTLVVCFRGQEQADVRYEITLQSDDQPRKIDGVCP